jgi:hypothetical protein
VFRVRQSRILCVKFGLVWDSPKSRSPELSLTIHRQVNKDYRSSVWCSKIQEAVCVGVSKLLKPEASEFLLAIYHGKKCGPLIPKLFGNSPVRHLGYLECILGNISKPKVPERRCCHVPNLSPRF